MLALAERAAIELDWTDSGVAAQGERDVQVSALPDLVDRGDAQGRRLRERVREIDRAMAR
ncbi:hypothetical protein [Actinacidiphila sp. bgisy160]|uniref:hypothetical protein n=1 Tax=Actinacidiphila sp. bgisy160 TaxID=3413796 RepID=UPI003D75CCC5